MSEWKDIETAPLGADPVLLALPSPFSSNDVHGYAPWGEIRVVIGWRDYSGYWVCCFMEDGAADTEGYSSQFFMSVQPTHWMPLPAPPVTP